MVVAAATMTMMIMIRNMIVNTTMGKMIATTIAMLALIMMVFRFRLPIPGASRRCLTPPLPGQSVHGMWRRVPRATPIGV